MKIRVVAPPKRNPLLVGFKSIPGTPSTIDEVVVLGKPSMLLYLGIHPLPVKLLLHMLSMVVTLTLNMLSMVATLTLNMLSMAATDHRL